MDIVCKYLIIGLAMALMSLIEDRHSPDRLCCGIIDEISLVFVFSLLWPFILSAWILYKLTRESD